MIRTVTREVHVITREFETSEQFEAWQAVQRKWLIQGTPLYIANKYADAYALHRIQGFTVDAENAEQMMGW